MTVNIASRVKPASVTLKPITKIGALKLAAWLYYTHPTLFTQVYKKARTQAQTASKLSNLKGIGCCPQCDANKVTSLSDYRAYRISRIGRFGDVSMVDVTSGLDSGLDSNLVSSSDISSAISSDSGSSGGFWSSLGSDLSSAGSSIVSGIGDVGSYLGSTAGLNSLTSLANDYFAGKTISAQSAEQQAILQAQTQRVAQGYNPAATGYTTNAYGQVVPVTYTANGTVPITSTNFASIFSGTNHSWLLWGGLGLGAVLILGKLL